MFRTVNKRTSQYESEFITIFKSMMQNIEAESLHGSNEKRRLLHHLVNTTSGDERASAAYELGMLYSAENEFKAAHWICLAAEKGHKKAIVTRQIKQVDFDSWYDCQADHYQDLLKTALFASWGCPRAQAIVGELYLSSQPPAQDVTLGLEWLLKAADKNLAQAQLLLGIAYSRVDYGVLDKIKADGWMKKCIEQNDPLAFSMACLYFDKQRTPKLKKAPKKELNQGPKKEFIPRTINAAILKPKKPAPVIYMDTDFDSDIEHKNEKNLIRKEELARINAELRANEEKRKITLAALEKEENEKKSILSLETLKDMTLEIKQKGKDLKLLVEKKHALKNNIVQLIKNTTSTLDELHDTKYIKYLEQNLSILNALDELHTSTKQLGNDLLQDTISLYQLCMGLEGRGVDGELTPEKINTLKNKLTTFSEAKEALKLGVNEENRMLLKETYSYLEEKRSSILKQYATLEEMICQIKKLEATLTEREKVKVSSKRLAKDENETKIKNYIERIKIKIKEIDPTNSVLPKQNTTSSIAEESAPVIVPVFEPSSVISEAPVAVIAPPDTLQDRRGPYQKRRISKKEEISQAWMQIQQQEIKARTLELEQEQKRKEEEGVEREVKVIKAISPQKKKLSVALTMHLNQLDTIVNRLKLLDKGEEWSEKMRYALLGSLAQVNELIYRERSAIPMIEHAINVDEICQVAKFVRNALYKCHGKIKSSDTELLTMAEAWSAFLQKPLIGHLKDASIDTVLNHVNSFGLTELYKLGTTLSQNEKKVSQDDIEQALRDIEIAVGYLFKPKQEGEPVEEVNVAAEDFCKGILGSAKHFFDMNVRYKIPDEFERFKKAFGPAWECREQLGSMGAESRHKQSPDERAGPQVSATLFMNFSRSSHAAELKLFSPPTPSKSGLTATPTASFEKFSFNPKATEFMPGRGRG